MTTFVPFPKIPRYSREVVVSEKIDGTNACVFVGEDGEFLVGSRSKWITPHDDNHGFALWAHANRDALMALGPGYHRGEWWGNGINRGYGLARGDKRFSLFNVVRWCLCGDVPQRIETGDPRIEKFQDVLPACVGLVPILWRGPFDLLDVAWMSDELARCGSRAAPGYMNPEGIVIYHRAGNVSFKKTLQRDDEPKCLRRNEARPPTSIRR